jgi:poly(A) polymerase/tRNA nucleotidyltransferase (CCA-adding enzyme)
MKRILAADDPRAAVALMEGSGVLALVMPADATRLAALVERGAPVEPMLRMAALLDGDAAALAEGLKLSGAESETLAALRVPNRLTPGASDADLRRALAGADQAVLMARTWLGQDERPGWDDLRARIEAMTRPVLPVQGRDIMAMEIPPGPEVGEILAAVRDWWMAGGCVADAAACRAEARRLIMDRKPKSRS